RHHAGHHRREGARVEEAPRQAAAESHRRARGLMPVYLYDDPADLTGFVPFTASRPIGELRYGAWLLRERVEGIFGAVGGHLSPPHLADFNDPDAPPVVAAPEAKGSLILRSSFVPGTERPDFSSYADAPGVKLTDQSGTVIGAQLRKGTDWAGP